MRLHSNEREVSLPLPVLKQRITVLCEQQPKRYSNNALHTNADGISFTVNSVGNELVYAIVSGASEVDGKTKLSIETFSIDTNWPVWLSIYITATIFYVLFVKPSTFYLCIPIILPWGLAIRPLLLPLFHLNNDGKALTKHTEALLDLISRSDLDE